MGIIWLKPFKMKLFTSLALCSFAHAADVTCMESDADDAKIQMTATVLESEVARDLTEDGFTLTNGVYTKVWTAGQFTSADMSVDDSGDLVLSKQVSKSCSTTNVDGVDVCIATGHTLDFKCTYGLGTKTVHSTFDVSGHDTIDSAEGVGTLNYNLVVDDNAVDIGETVSVTISPVNEIGIWARLQDCQVTYQSVPVSILDWSAADNEINPVCDLTAAVETGISQKDLKFSWSAFKWATQTVGGIEQQEISCEISLSKDEPAYQIDGCVTTQSDSPAEKPTFSDVAVPDQKTQANEISWKTCKPVTISGKSAKACASTFDDRPGFEGRNVDAAFDGDAETIWHSCWKDSFDGVPCTPTDKSAFLIVFDEPQEVSTFHLTKRNNEQKNTLYNKVCLTTYTKDPGTDSETLNYCTNRANGDGFGDPNIYLDFDDMDIVWDFGGSKMVQEIMLNFDAGLAGMIAEIGIDKAP